MESRFAPALLASLLLCSACSPRNEPPAAEPPALVKTHRIAAAAAPSRTFPGNLSAHRSADLAFEIGGVVQELLADTGARVEPGQPLARLDARDFESRLLAARAEASRAGTDAERARALLAQNAIAPARVDALAAAAEAAAAALAQAQKAFDDATLRAPFAGVVAARFVDRFASIQPKTLAYRVHDLSAFTVAIDLPQSLVLASQRRERSTGATIENVSFTAHFNDPSASAAGHPLHVNSFSTDPDPRTGTYRFELTLPAPPDLVLLPGMSCTVRITLPAPPAGQVLVPPSAVATDAAKGPVAWVVDGESRARPRPVTLGALTAQGLVVSSGLAPGEVVITAGLAQLTPGRAVRPL
jgi:RND family efflux transporter MFP subunit